AAEADSGTVQPVTQIDEESKESANPNIVIMYPHFTGNLVHDPIIGLSTSSGLLGVPYWVWGVGGVVVVAVVAGVVVFVKRK
ncbi:hypothetical protein KIPB_002333, partial [Kipferlia bialata]